MLEYAFMRRALIIGFFLGLAIPLMGVVVINRRTSTIGDALAHTSLAGIGLGLIAGLSPLFSAVLMTLIGSFAIELLRKKFPQNGDLATAMVMSTGIGLASIFSDFAPSGSNFESFLFGSIITGSTEEVYAIVGLSLVIFIAMIVFFYPILYISLDRNGARISGLPVGMIENFFTVLLSLTVALSSKTIGVLMVSSLLILPVASAMLFTKSYKSCVILSMIIGCFLVMFGLFASFYMSIKPGGAIVITGVFLFLIFLVIQKFILKRK